MPSLAPFVEDTAEVLALKDLIGKAVATVRSAMEYFLSKKTASLTPSLVQYQTIKSR